MFSIGSDRVNSRLTEAPLKLKTSQYGGNKSESLET